MTRPLPYALAFLLSASPCIALATTPPRDWAAFPAVVTVDHVSTIDALGDIHGDYEKATQLLAGTHLIRHIPTTPLTVEWTGGTTTLVCTGDMIDKGPQSLEVLRLMRALQASAAANGGRVIVTLGNHEAEFLAAHGENKKAAEFQEELNAHHLSPSQLAAGEDSEGLGTWLRNLPAAAKVDDWFFCHAGNTFGSTLPALESAIENGVNKDGFGTFVLAEPNSLLEARMHPVPWWLSTPPAPAEKNATGLQRLRATIAALGCKHLVIGHQPGKIDFGSNIVRKSGEVFAYEGLLFLIDTGMSRGVQNGTPELLHITSATHPHDKEKATLLDTTGTEHPLWQEK